MCIRDSHDLAQRQHLQFARALVPLREPFLRENALVEKSFILRQFFEAIWDAVISVADDKDQEVVLLYVVLFVGAEAVVVVDEAAQCRLQLAHVLVVHRDADGEGRRTLPNIEAPLVNLRQQARLLDVASLAVLTEAGASYL